MKKILVIVITVVMILTLTACGKGGEDEGTAIDISGYYELKSVTSASGTPTTDEDIQMLKQLGIVASLECFSDGTAVLDLFGDQMNYTYDTDKMVFSLEGEEVSFKYEDGNITLVDGEDSLTFAPADKG